MKNITQNFIKIFKLILFLIIINDFSIPSISYSGFQFKEILNLLDKLFTLFCNSSFLFDGLI